MKNRIRKLVLSRPIVWMIIMLNLFPLAGESQSLSSRILQNNIHRYREALYLQTDRDIYVSGEKVWFKVTKLNASEDIPGSYSRIVYIELLNRSGYPVNQIRMEVDHATASSAFLLSDTLGTGKYLLRAYTNWMKNFSQTKFAFKTISVINPDQRPAAIYKENPGIDTIYFYPEEGKYIAGVHTKVEVKGLNALGDILPVSGAVVNREGDTVCKVFSPKNRPGFFSFIPYAGERYHFSFQDAQGENQQYPLGKIHPVGIKLLEMPAGNNSSFHFSFVSSPAWQGEGGYLFYRKGGIYKFLRNINPSENKDFILDKQLLPKGISDILVTDHKGLILCTRQIFNPPTDSILIEVHFDKTGYGPRELVRVTIHTTHDLSDPVQADLTVTIVKSGLIRNKRKNIRNREEYKTFFLTGFTNTRDMDSDSLSDYPPFEPMVSNTANILSVDKIKYYPEIENKLISGTITDYSSGQPMSRSEMFLSYVNKIARCRIFSTDNSGNFFINVNETGNREIVIQPYLDDRKNYYVELRQDFLPRVTHPLPGSYFPDTASLGVLENAIITKQIKDIFLSDQTDHRENSGKSRNYNFYGKPVHRIVLSDYIPLSDVREVIKEIVPWVSVRKKKGQTSLQMHSDFKDIVLNNPLVLVDGTPFTDINQLLKLPASKIQAIDVINLRYFMGPHVFNGIIHFITTKGNLESLDLDPKIFRVDYPILDQKIEAQFPEYTPFSNTHKKIPDFRNTLYWNPKLHTGNNGITTFDFYTSDEAGEYTLFIEGISPDGKTGTVTHNLIIK